MVWIINALLDRLFFKANFHDDKGEHIGSKYFDPRKETFDYLNETYNYSTATYSFQTEKRFWLIFKRRTYYYTKGIPDPIDFTRGENRGKTVPFDAQKYSIMLKTKVAKDLNTPKENPLMALLTPRNIIIVVGAFFVIRWLMNGGLGK